MNVLMTGKCAYRVDAQQVTLWGRPDGPGTGARKAGTKTADLEITIDLDELRTALARDAMRTKSCRLTRVRGTIRVRPVKGALRVTGGGRPT